MNTFNVTLDLNKGKVTTPIRIRQGDLDGTTIHALILDHGASVDLTGLTAAFVMELPGGEHYYRKTATVGDGTVDVTINEVQAASVTGRTTRAYFQFYEGSTMRASTGSMVVEILPDALEGHTVPEDYDSEIQDAIDALDDAVEHIADTVEDVLEDHPEWTTTVQDGSISQDKLARDVAEPLDRLMYRLDNLHTHACAESELVTASDAAQTPVAGLAIYGKSTQDGTPTPSAPVPIVSVAGNLLDPSMVLGAYISNTAITASGTQATYYLPCEPSTSYTVSKFFTASTNRFVIACTDTTPAAGVTVTDRIQVQAANLDTYVGQTVSRTITTGASSRYIVVWADQPSVSVEQNLLRLYRGSATCPYVPYDHMGLWARGRNILHTTAPTQTVSGVTFTRNEDGSILAVGTSTETVQLMLVPLDSGFLTLPAGTYTLSGCPSGGSNTTWKLDLATRVSGTIVDIGIDFGSGATFTLDEKTTLQRCRIVIYSGKTVNMTFRPMLVSGSTATPYQPYSESVLPIPLDGHELRSLPDGTRDELTVDERGHVVLVQRVGTVTFDGTETWGLSGGGGYRVNTTAIADSVRPAASNTETFAAYCDRFVGSTDQATYRGTVGVSVTTTGTIGVTQTGAATTVAAWKSWLTSNPVTLLYPLATPVTHDLGIVDPVPMQGPDLTAQPIPDTTMALTYEVDANVADETALACIAPVEGDTATANYSVGGYLVHGGQLCRVTTAIATGEAISIGTNVVATTVMAEVIRLTQ